MTTATGKLVDKYQYNENQIIIKGDVQFISAKHILLKQHFTLKKINISNPKVYNKYLQIINEMNILKVLNGSSFILKCHKMLKTSNNLYVVFDKMGTNPTLDQYLCKRQQINQETNKSIIFQLLHILKEMKNLSISHFELNPKNMQISQNKQIKLINLEGALFINRNISVNLLINLEKTIYTAPEVLDFFRNNCQNSQTTGELSLVQHKLTNSDIYSFGKIIAKVFGVDARSSNGKGLFSGKIAQNSEIKNLIEKMVNKNQQERLSIEEIQKELHQILFLQNDSHKNARQILSSSTKPSFRQSNLTLSPAKLQICKSTSKLHTSASYLSPQRDDQIQRSFNSRKSSGQISDNQSITKTTRKRSSFISEAEESTIHFQLPLVYKIMKRRNLCRMLLSIAKTIFSVHFVDQNIRIMLAFLYIKKSVLLICSLARYLSTGKGQNQQFPFRQAVRKDFAKTQDFAKLIASINKQMDLARSMFQSCIQQINQNMPQLLQNKQFNFKYECKSDSISSDLWKRLIKRQLVQIVNKIGDESRQKKVKKQLAKRTSISSKHNLTPQPNFLSTSVRSYKQTKNLQVYDRTISVHSAKSVNSNLSNSTIGQVSIEQVSDQNVQKFLNKEQVINLYFMGLMLDFQTYQRLFQKLIIDQQVLFQRQTAITQLSKMTVKEILIKVQQILKAIQFHN